MDNQLRELPFVHCEGLFPGERKYIFRLWMQDVVPRLERNPEPAFPIRLDLDESFALEAVDAQNSLVRRIRAFLPNLHHRASGTDEYLSLDPAIHWRGWLGGTGRQNQDQDTDRKLYFHFALLSTSHRLMESLFCSPLGNGRIEDGQAGWDS